MEFNQGRTAVITVYFKKHFVASLSTAVFVYHHILHFFTISFIGLFTEKRKRVIIIICIDYFTIPDHFPCTSFTKLYTDYNMPLKDAEREKKEDGKIRIMEDLNKGIDY